MNFSFLSSSYAFERKKKRSLLFYLNAAGGYSVWICTLHTYRDEYAHSFVMILCASVSEPRGGACPFSIQNAFTPVFI